MQLMKHKDFPRIPLILIAKGKNLTCWQEINPLNDLKALKRFIKTKDTTLNEIV